MLDAIRCHPVHQVMVHTAAALWNVVLSHGTTHTSPTKPCAVHVPDIAPLAPPDANKQLALQHMPQSGVATVAQAMRNAYESRVPFDSLVGVLTNAAGCLRALVEDNRKPQLCPAPWAQHLTCEPTHKLQPWRCKKQWTVAFSRSLLAA